ncbi:cell division protein FtsZ [Planktosalinus lacus]|uniref:Cell division protein FtsZ n=1 Tax=Planktosalinus lacus TaxID=1526573 RepID=A0A8J2Y8X8_9FLAO|nr:cell division protein FtsZ [Planktosalinus lacus]GGD89281.1 cell division protein FtsZ [Planktosalinus lacus]
MSSNNEFNKIEFDLPKNQSNVIKVIGVGGGGSNAINHMFQQGIKGVDFVICNTDSQALENSPVPIKIQLGVSLTEGLGAGANPEIGKDAAIESMDEIKDMLSTNTKMIFITAGMGGGTGTGAAPIIAKMAKELDVLTVGIVTIPFQFEGKTRNEQAQIGVENLRRNVDSLIVINNNKLREVYGNLGFKAGFSKADEVLATASRGIAEVITHHYTQNIDLRDARTVLANSGTAIMGSASAVGSNRAHEAITNALDSPLLNDNKISGAKNVLLLIVSGSEEITIDEIGEISDHIQQEAGHGANIIMGVGEDESLDSAISVTVIATGFNAEQQNEIVNTETKKIIHTLEDEQAAEQVLVSKQGNTDGFKKAQEPQKKEEPIIKHTLFDEEVEEQKPEQPFEGYIKTSEFLKNISVSYEEIAAENLDEFDQDYVNTMEVNDFVIVEATSKSQQTETKNSPEEDKNQMLMFDLPLNKSEETKDEQEDTEESTVNDYEVKGAVEIIPVTEVSKDGVKRYSLDDYQDIENHLAEAKPNKKEAPKEPVDNELVFEKRTVSDNTPDADTEEEVDPMNTSINNLLRKRTEERKQKMKAFNYKFNNNSSRVDELEKQPAYKRLGIELDEHSSDKEKISRTTLSTDENDEIQLRSNNSFLHDNVD